MYPCKAPVNFYRTGRKAETKIDLKKAEETCRLAAGQKPDNSAHIRAVPQMAHCCGRSEDARKLYPEEQECVGRFDGCGNAMVTSLMRGSLGA